MGELNPCNRALKGTSSRFEKFFFLLLQWGNVVVSSEQDERSEKLYELL